MEKKFNVIPAEECTLDNLKRASAHGSPVYVSTHMTGKLLGVPAISTSVLANPICKARAAVPGSICAHCFAQSTVSRYEALRDHVDDNYKVLNARDLLPEELPVINSDICRLEAFGDLASVTQARNYIRIAERSPWCTFTLWTKNPEFMDQAIKALGKPANLICILSSFHLNRVDDASKYPWVDHVFTVYDAETIEREGVEINCGARSCRTCMQCYKHGTAFHINEKLK